MRVKATKVMAKELQKALTDGTKVDCIKLGLNDYECFVNFHAIENENDYDWDTMTFNVLKVTYPDNYYAMPAYISTNDLLRLFRGLQEKTIENFRGAFADLVMI